MSLPLARPLAPMDARLVEAIPQGPDWQYEPKWDGFRCLVFRDGRKVDLQSKSGQPLTRYFPELVETFLVEVSYDHFTGGRFRHGTRLLRWRPDKAPQQCRMDQVARTGSGSLRLLQPAVRATASTGAREQRARQSTSRLRARRTRSLKVLGLTR